MNLNSKKNSAPPGPSGGSCGQHFYACAPRPLLRRAGSGPDKEIVRMVKDGEISFQHVVTFNMDEYVGIDKAHPESYHAFM